MNEIKDETKTSIKKPRKKQTTNIQNKEVKDVSPVVATSQQVDTNMYITVRNGHHGTLIYKSKRTGECYRWEEYGDEQEIQLRELKDAKNFCKKMFSNNWFVFNEEDQWVIDYLGVRSFYKNSIGFGSFDDIFNKPTEELKNEILQMTDGQKSAVAHRARQLIVDGIIDSRRCISALEEALEINLIEK